MRRSKFSRHKSQLCKRGGSSAGGGGVGVEQSLEKASKLPSGSTAQEAEDWANANLSPRTTYDKDADPKFLQDVNQILGARLEQWKDKLAPMLDNGKFDSIRIIKGGGGTDGMLAGAIPNTSQLIFNARNGDFKIWEKHRDYSLKYADKKGNTEKLPWGAEVHVPKSKVGQFVIDHELAHVIHYGLGKAKQDKFATLVKSEYSKGWRPVSAYSKVNKNEEFAEIFAVHANGRRDLLTPKLNSFLDKL